MKKIITITLLLVAFTFLRQLSAQQVIIEESPLIASFLHQYIDAQQAEENVRGWRVQIISTDNRREMEKAKAKFEMLYPDIETSWTHMVPYYQVRVGAYEDKSKLMAFMLEVKEEFPTATPVVDDIPKSAFIR